MIERYLEKGLKLCEPKKMSEALKTFIDIITPYKTQHEIEEEKRQEEDKNKIEVFTIRDKKGYERDFKPRRDISAACS